MGNICYQRFRCMHPAVHPHMHGEYKYACCYDVLHLGSSPHAWGILTSAVRDIVIRWFIPTCVGNTQWLQGFQGFCSVHPHMRGCLSPNCVPHTVHPHMRGEYVALSEGAVSSCGSSPHAWGIRICECLSHLVLRFIPTCVGNTYHKYFP